MKAKAKEIQRIEQETIKHQEASRTALEAIGGPKKRKFGRFEYLRFFFYQRKFFVI